MSARILPAALAAVLVLAAPYARAEKAQVPVRDKISMCTGCHGIVGYRTAFPKVYHVPRIGGQNPAYLANALKEYRAKQRWHPSMQGIAESLSDEDIQQLAQYYGRKK